MTTNDKIQQILETHRKKLEAMSPENLDRVYKKSREINFDVAGGRRVAGGVLKRD